MTASENRLDYNGYNATFSLSAREQCLSYTAVQVLVKSPPTIAGMTYPALDIKHRLSPIDVYTTTTQGWKLLVAKGNYSTN